MCINISGEKQTVTAFWKDNKQKKKSKNRSARWAETLFMKCFTIAKQNKQYTNHNQNIHRFITDLYDWESALKGGPIRSELNMKRLNKNVKCNVSVITNTRSKNMWKKSKNKTVNGLIIEHKILSGDPLTCQWNCWGNSILYEKKSHLFSFSVLLMTTLSILNSPPLTGFLFTTLTA